jgi:predicted transcriptional regulator
VVAFMPIKPTYAMKLIAGLKKYEFRRTAIRQDITHIIIYASSPVKKIIGIAEVESVNVASPTAIWESTKRDAGITRKEYRKYFQGTNRAVAIKIKDVIRLTCDIEPDKIRDGFKVPQSFLYIDMDFVKGMIHKGMKNMISCELI